VLGTLFAYPADDALLELARTVAIAGALTGDTPQSSVSDVAHSPTGGPRDGGQGGERGEGAARAVRALIACTKVDGVLVCRAVGSQADAVRRAFASIWSLIRPQIAGRAATPPRIWST
jgi:hypothetical protein